MPEYPSARRSRVIFVNRFYWPDESATAQILTDLAEALAERGRSVTIVCSRLSYADTETLHPAEETRKGVRIRRLRTSRFGRGSLAGRLMDYVSFYISVVFFLLQKTCASDIVVLKTDPPLLSVPGYFASKLVGFRMVNWCQDLFPEIAIQEFRLAGFSRFLAERIAMLRDLTLRESEAVVVLGEDMQDYLQSRGGVANNAFRINNWSVQTPVGKDSESKLRAEWGLPEDAFVLGYSGNLGRAHDWQTVLEAAKRLSAEEKLFFLCVGGGAGYEALRIAVDQAQLGKRFRFLPYQPLELLETSLRVPDVHWLTLKASLTPFIFPSKFFGILQAGRAALFVGDAKAEISRLILDNKAGAAVPEGDAASLAACLQRYLHNHGLAREEGDNARRLWERSFRKDLAFSRWEGMLEQVGKC